MLGTLLVNVETITGKWVTLRAMVDDGSMVSLISRQAADLVGVMTQQVFKLVTAADGKKLKPILREVNLHLQNLVKNFKAPFIVEEVGIVDRLPMTLPIYPLKMDLPKSISITLADPTFTEPRGIDILIAAGAWAMMKREGSHRVGKCFIQNTIFGHVVQGSLEPAKKLDRYTVATVLSASDHRNIKADFKRAFEYETPAVEKDDFAEIIFSEQHKRLPCGRYEVPLIWGSQQELGNSYNICFRRNRRLLEKLDKTQIQEVLNVLRKYRDSDIIRVCKDNEGTYYAPFVFVWRNTVTTPLRICLDASQKSSNGLSVNDIQLVGAKLQPDIVEQLLRFRQHRVAVIADISQMYLNIRVREEDRKYQRSILNIPESPVQEIEYNTVLFGATCAPFLAQRVIKQLAIDEKERFPLGADVLKTCAYIDDIAYSKPSNDMAKESLKELTAITATAGFHLHKIASNDAVVLDGLPPLTTLQEISSKKSSSVLGVQWQFEEADELFIEFTNKPIGKLTKRRVLSIIASIFDPLGLICPLVMPAKFLMQEIWFRDRLLKSPELDAAWNEEVADDIASRFSDWYASLTGLQEIRINRNTGFDLALEQSLYGYVDASQKGYGAVIYLRTIIENSVRFDLIISKGRVAPIMKDVSEKIQSLTIPRLELCSALLGAELIDVVKKAWNLDDSFPVAMFTDSEIVLAQISSNTIRDVFTENRLRKIRKLVNPVHWYHVQSGDNPADLITRGGSISDLLGTWKEGPAVMRDVEFRPTNKFPVSYQGNCNVIISETDAFHLMLQKFSSFKKTLRVMARVIQASQKFKDKTFKMEVLTAERLTFASNVIFRIVQAKYYQDELDSLRKGQPVTNGALATKNAFIDSKGVLRIGTRVQIEEVDYDERNPVVLPPIQKPETQENHIGYQIIHDTHHENIHGGVSSTIADIKQKFFLPGLRFGVQRFISNCQLCVRIRARHQTQMMGNLPKEVVIKNPAFWHVTLDYCGPISLKTKLRATRRSGNEDLGRMATLDKAWILLIACFTTGAYHLEVVPNLEATSFLKAFKNFTNTRGVPHSVRSDNATTFHRSSDMLAEIFEKYRASLKEGILKLQEFCGNKNIRWVSLNEFSGVDEILWNFNPPLASHFGGKHERGIRSVRDKLRKAIGLEKLLFVDLHALLKEIEGVLNSRPLLRARGVFEEGDFVLTPGHFLIGRPLNSLPRVDCPSKNVSSYDAYKTRMKIENGFWEVFHKSHLQELANRSKWYRKTKNLYEGDLVILHEDNTPPLSWRKGVITKVIKGKEGLVRVVTVQTAFGEFTRPVSKVVWIPGGVEILDERKLNSPLGGTPEVAKEKTLQPTTMTKQNADSPIRRSQRIASRKENLKLQGDLIETD